MANIPNTFRAAVFPSPKSDQLEIREVEMKRARENGSSLLLFFSSAETKLTFRSSSSSNEQKSSSAFTPPFSTLRACCSVFLLAPGADPLLPPRNSDQIVRNDLVPGLHFPITPGSVAVGEVVEVGKQSTSIVGRKFEKGDRIAGSSFSSPLLSFLRSTLTLSSSS
jgi:hypothetical protein